MLAPIDQDRLAAVAASAVLPKIQTTYGRASIEHTKELFLFLKKLYRSIEPETIRGRLIVFFRLEGIQDQNIFQNPVTCDFDNIFHRLQTNHQGDTFVSVLGDGQIIFWQTEGNTNLTVIAGDSIVYFYQGFREFFFINGREEELAKISNNYASAFSIPTFRNLGHALDNYSNRFARKSTCQILLTAWFNQQNGNRLFFKNRPEATMRKSLTQYLQTVLPDAEVRPEQNVDETHPVDIKVTWMLNNRRAIIEIKWLGQSMNADGDALGTGYTATRANAGARQLAEYLEDSARFAPDHLTIGYLVVFDGRRRNLALGMTEITREDGLHYENEDIPYNPEYHNTRNDFEPPIRMFAEPRCIA